jgi:hypothetical protein
MMARQVGASIRASYARPSHGVRLSQVRVQRTMSPHDGWFQQVWLRGRSHSSYSTIHSGDRVRRPKSTKFTRSKESSQQALTCYFNVWLFSTPCTRIFTVKTTEKTGTTYVEN